MSILDDEIVGQISEAVLTAQEILAGQELQLPRISQLKVYDMPASVLAHQLYEDDSKAALLVNLNPNLDPLLYQEQVDILGGLA